MSQVTIKIPRLNSRCIRFVFITYALIVEMLLCESAAAQKSNIITNPIMDGYFADPSILKYQGKYYIYATIDPWGGEELAVFESADFKKWEQKHMNWPTKQQCTSPTSGGAKVWAPSVVQENDGKFYMYVSVGSEIWAGVSSHPLGPWKNAKPDNTPLVNKTTRPDVHTIDSDCFIDDDGQAYLYWGSGWKWVNGHCMAAKLKKDMITFDGEPVEITPPHYFEGPHMIKRNNIYYLMYSDGKAIDHTYKVRYSTSSTPMGPWTEGTTSPVLQTTSDSTTYGPGHHTVFREGKQDYILYHRIHPQKEKYVLRQLCIDSLNFDSSGAIRKIGPKGVRQFAKREK